MNAQKFTQKSLEALQAAQDLAIEHQNMQLEKEHLLAALLTQEQGLIPQLLLKMNLPAEQLEICIRDRWRPFPFSGRLLLSRAG